MVKITLKPCPFCGGEPEIWRKGGKNHSMLIGCNNCGCELWSDDIYRVTKPKDYKWNKRHEEIKPKTAPQS